MHGLGKTPCSHGDSASLATSSKCGALATILLEHNAEFICAGPRWWVAPGTMFDDRRHVCVEDCFFAEEKRFHLCFVGPIGLTHTTAPSLIQNNSALNQGQCLQWRAQSSAR